jgi:hypothetical protein
MVRGGQGWMCRQGAAPARPSLQAPRSPPPLPGAHRTSASTGRGGAPAPAAPSGHAMPAAARHGACACGAARRGAAAPAVAAARASAARQAFRTPAAVSMGPWDGRGRAGRRCKRARSYCTAWRCVCGTSVHGDKAAAVLAIGITGRAGLASSLAPPRPLPSPRAPPTPATTAGAHAARAAHAHCPAAPQARHAVQRGHRLVPIAAMQNRLLRGRRGRHMGQEDGSGKDSAERVQQGQGGHARSGARCGGWAGALRARRGVGGAQRLNTDWGCPGALFEVVGALCRSASKL